MAGGMNAKATASGTWATSAGFRRSTMARAVTWGEVRSLDRGLAPRQAPLDVLFHRFHHDNGVVHDEADGEHEGEQRQRVDREPQQRKDREGADE